MMQAAWLSSLGISTFSMTEARLQEIASLIDGLARQDASSMTIRARLTRAGLSREDVDRAAAKLTRGRAGA